MKDRGAEMLGISADSHFVHQAFTEARGVSIPLLSDVHRTAMKAYGVHDEDRNVAFRSTFIVDKDGVLRWGQTGDRQMVRDGHEILRVLDLIGKIRRS